MTSDQPPQELKWHHNLFGPITNGAARAVVVLFILAFFLAGAAYFLSVRAVRGEIASRATVEQLCRTADSFNRQQVTLWTHLVAMSTPPPHETPAQRARREQLTREFLAYVQQVFKPHDCSRG